MDDRANAVGESAHGGPASLARDVVQVWWWPTAEVRKIARGVLSGAEQKRTSFYRFQADQDRFATGAALVRHLAAAHLNVDPAAVDVDRTCGQCGAQHGPPRIRATNLRVSVSHSGAWVAVAGTQGEAVGVDIEVADRLAGQYEDLAPLLLAEDETCAPDRLVHRWTQKEAVLKASGHGLRMGLTRLAIDDGPAGPRVIRFDDAYRRLHRWSLTELDAPLGIVATLAVLADVPPIVQQRR